MAWLLGLAFYPGAAWADHPDLKHVLHLASYHRGYAWTEDIQGGIESILLRPGQNPAVRLQVDYLDTKRASDEVHFQNLVRLFQHKYAQADFELVITSDDDAFEFMKRFGKDLFPGVPTVFCGVNNFSDARLEGQDNITGVAEEIDLGGTIEVALKLFPRAKRLAVISDHTTTGLLMQKVFKSVYPAFQDRVSAVTLAGLGPDELREALRSLASDSVGLYLTYFRDPEGRTYGQHESMSLVTGMADMPFFSVWSFAIGHGVVGGMVTHGFHQGRTAALKALRILSGEAARDIPILRESPNHYVFDDRVLKRFAIDRSNLPAGSEVVNVPGSLYQRYKAFLWPAVGVVGAQSLVILALLTSIRRRRRAEQALRESEQKHRILLEESTDPIFSFAPDGTYRYVNNAFAAPFGKRPEDIIGKRIWDLFPPDEATMRFEVVKDVFERGQTRVIEVRVPHPDGDLFFVTSVKPIMGKSGQVVSVQCISKEITERKRAELALRESEQRHRELVEGSFDGIWVQKQARIVFANQRLHQILGYPEGELLGLEHWKVYHPDYHGLTKDRAQARLRGETPEPRYEVKAQRKDGSSFEAEISAKAITLEGEPGIQVWLRDITERKQAEATLRESEERYRSLFDSISDFIYTHDLQGRFLTVNRAIFRTLGYTPEEIIGRPISDLMLPEFQQGFHTDYLPEVINRGHISGLARFLAKDGQLHHIEFRNRMVSEEGREPYVSGSGRDITERVIAEHELHRLEEQLAQAQKMEAVGVLAGGVAHDFNNILQAISGYVQLLLGDQEIGPRPKDHLARVDQAVNRAADLVQRLLTFSRKADKKTEMVDLNREIEQVVQLLERTIPKMIRIELALAPDLKRIMADPTQVEQVIVNLAGNARDAMPEGGVLTIATRNVSLSKARAQALLDVPPGDYVLLEVGDTGSGMDNHTLEHIFEPFFTTKEVGQGTGLGLSTVYGIVVGHGGHIACKSKAGQGTRFLIYLPVATDQDSALTAKPQPAPEPPSGHETILLVDDEEAILATAQEALTSCGYSVLTAGTGEKALDIYLGGGKPVDLVILDLSMPGMGGRKALAHLVKADPDVRVLVATGYADDDVKEEINALGAVGIIGKPYRFSDLLTAIRKALEKN